MKITEIPFTKESLRDKLVEVASNPKYAESMRRLKRLSKGTPGLEGACNAIEKALEVGY